MTKRSELKAEKAAQDKLVEARAGAIRVTIKAVSGESDEVVRARLGFEYQRAGLELNDDFEAAVKAISEGRTP